MNNSTKNNLQHASDNAKNYYENVKDSACEIGDYISDKAEKYSKNVQSKFNNTEDKLISYTKSNPLKALGFAGLIGYVLSKIL